MQWLHRTFDELTTVQLYAILALRQRVFVVEQACAYLDADGYDVQCQHLWAEDAAIHGYLRIVPSGVKYAEASIGRVVVAPEARGTGLGRELVRRGLEVVGAQAIRIGAQAHLERFYGEFGFRRVSEIYDEDGIPHIDMLRA